MASWIDALAYLDLVDPVEGFISTFRYANWDGAYRRAGVIGLVTEFCASLAAMNCWTIWVERDKGWSGIEIERLLFRHGVRVWGRGFLDEQLFFRVKKRQARWAEYVLLRRAVPIAGAPFDPCNYEYAERHDPGSEPLNKSKSPDLIEQLLSFFR
ncbi:MAG: hypothetical protein A2Z03_05075 [Chloroflexi bacterium RBG_16_56_8]|nr:MAG: hypothetical protein A2Z03_05075 [Chloroflexi bacterium RBG_16_56_8]